MVRIGAFWFLLAGAYLALVGSVSIAEAAASVLCGGLGATWTWRLAACGAHHLHMPLAGLGPLGAAFLKLPRETLAVGARPFRAAAAGDVSGEDRAVPPFAAARCPVWALG